MDGGTLRLFWERVSKTKFDIGTYENFKSAMADPNRRKKFFDSATSNGLDIGTFEEFEKRIMGDEVPSIKSKTLTFNKTPKINVPTKPCDDFPFTLGCVNTKIGDLNAKYFGGDRLNDTYGKLLENYLENKGYFSDSNNELTKDTWDYLMNKNIIKESVKKVLKEHINKK